jgi:hypothetical protein
MGSLAYLWRLSCRSTTRISWHFPTFLQAPKHATTASAMKIAFFSTHSYDMEFMDGAAEREGVTPTHSFA